MPSARYVALLRGINVGPHRRIAMPDLRSVVESVGHTDVATYLQSGNVVFTAAGTAAQRRPARLAAGIEQAIRDELKLEVDVLVRTGAELAAVIAHDPFAGEATDPARYHVVFLGQEPDAAGLAAIDVERFAPEQFAARGRELYLWTPAGVGTARLLPALQRVGPPGQVATARNWRTVLALHDLLEGV